MRLISAICFVTLLGGCEARPPPPVVSKPARPLPAHDAGPPAPLVEEPPPPASVAEFPAQPPPETAEGDGLIALLLDEPARAEAVLLRLDAPDAWQVALLAQLAVKRGGAQTDVLPEEALPEVRPDGGVLSPGQTAYVAAPGLTLKPLGAKKKAARLTLPFNTALQVKSVDGALATVSVEVAREVDFGPEGDQPTRVLTAPVSGTVEASWLSTEAHSAEALMRDARAQPDTEEGRARAVVLWHRALLLERSEAAREGLLRAAWVARRPSWVITAALTRNFAPASGARLAWGCRGDLSSAKWRAPGTRGVKGPLCVVDVDAREPCPFESPAVKEARKDDAAWRQREGVEEGPLLRVTVDAREPRALLLAASRLAYHDSCAEFEELTLDSHTASLRRLMLPLGEQATVVRVPVPAYHGTEYALLNAASERRAAAWMRSRARYRWTMGPSGQLQLSLQLDDQSYRVSPDATAVTVAAPPQKNCECNDD
ncbi:MAG: hypothetical protein AB1938_28015 [Myxococcota bacterium]